MTTIIVRSKSPCPSCGQEGHIDNLRTGARARVWRQAVNVVQHCIAEKGMGIGQAFYSALEIGKRNWTPELVAKFEKSMLPLIQERKLNIDEIVARKGC